MKQCRVFTKEKAKEDITEIYAYIAADNPSAAEAFLDTIEKVSQQLSAMPEMGSPRYFDHPHLHGLRFLRLQEFEHYLMFYRILKEEEIIEIIRIIHGARDLPALFGKKQNAQ